ncbi:MAG: carbohydrate ABC transporter substrate-binding protein [Acidimicrobiales bacterium]|nr:MAG: carbohydrate ABC transporter substrate-binding protein [Acidimicrobiales bacterium]
MNKRWLKLAAVPVALSLVAAACGSDSDSSSSSDTTEATTEGTSGGADISGATITVTGPERDESEAGSIQEVLSAWGEANGVEVTYTGDADWEANINTQVQGGNPPDISFFPQPGKLADFARAGNVAALTDEVAAAVDANSGEAWIPFGNVDGVQYGVPTKADLKSLVWYQPSAFEAAGYEVPTTFDEFTALVDQMTADGGPKALCVGIESGQATGWTFTDWVEDMVLRQHGPDVYDQWVNHDIPFNDPQIVESMQTVLDLWKDENVYASGGNIAATAFQDNGQPLVDGKCFMHRQASFYSAFFPEGTAYADGSDGAVDVFYFPDINGDKPVLGAGTLAAGFNDDPATMALLEYLSTADYAAARQTAQAALKGGGGALSGFLSPAKNQDLSVYQPLEQSFLDILATAAIVRFDASDLMPADVGAGTFWSEGTSAVTGAITAQEAADAIEASWPS